MRTAGLGVFTLLAWAAVAIALPHEDGQHIFVSQDGESKSGVTKDYEHVLSTIFPEHTLRITEPDAFCDSVKQYSGYLDVKGGKHFFFWYFEARNDPENAPMAMWLNGGPGCSSTTGLLWELGPCRVQSGGQSAEPNPYSWNEHANILFLDQPVQAGFSYADHGLPSTPLSAAKAAVDVHIFLQLFFERFPELGKKPFHLAGESWGGHFVPHIASNIFHGNRDIDAGRASGNKINLASIMIGNGMTDALHQFPPLAEYMCEGPYALLQSGSKECAALYDKSMRCERMVKACYDYNNPLVCMPAERYCWGLMNPVFDAKVNQYDVRKPCSEEQRKHLCYDEIADMEAFLNLPQVQAQLGVDPGTKFKACNMNIALAYGAQGGVVWGNTVRVVPELIEGGVRVLAYAGNTDAICNFMGVEAFVGGLPTSYAQEFAGAVPQKWTVGNRTAGYVRAAGGNGETAGNQTFIAVYEAGHMSPYDQPEATLDMFFKWINDQPISS